MSETYYGWMQKDELMDRISRSLMLKGPLSLAALCGAMYLTHSVVWAVMALALGRLVVLLAWDSRLGFARAESVARGFRLEGSSGEMLTLLRTALPLGVISMLNALDSSIPRYFLEAHAGSAELGIFSAIGSLLGAGTLVVNAFAQAIFLPVAKACAARDLARYRGYVGLAAVLGGALGGAGGVVAGLFGTAILTLLFRPEYGQQSGILRRLMIAGTPTFITCGRG